MGALACVLVSIMSDPLLRDHNLPRTAPHIMLPHPPDTHLKFLAITTFAILRLSRGVKARGDFVVRLSDLLGEPETPLNYFASARSSNETRQVLASLFIGPFVLPK